MTCCWTCAAPTKPSSPQADALLHERIARIEATGQRHRGVSNHIALVAVTPYQPEGVELAAKVRRRTGAGQQAVS